MAEFFVYFLLGIGVPGIAVWVLMKRREWKENQRRYPPLVMSPAADAKHVEKAWKQNAVVLGYDVHGKMCIRDRTSASSMPVRTATDVAVLTRCLTD